VTVGLYFAYGSLHYIPVALSTLEPSTSPHLSQIKLRLTGTTHPNFTSGTSALEDLNNDLRQIADEFSRIEREYGAVNLSVYRDMEFERLDALNVRFSFLWNWMRPRCGILAHSLQVLQHWDRSDGICG